MTTSNSIRVKPRLIAEYLSSASVSRLAHYPKYSIRRASPGTCLHPRGIPEPVVLGLIAGDGGRQEAVEEGIARRPGHSSPPTGRNGGAFS